MLYYNNIFKNAEEFKELFGIVNRGETKERKNKILLGYLKSNDIIHLGATTNPELLEIHDLASMKQAIMEKLQCYDGQQYRIDLMQYRFWSDSFSTDGYKGVTEDGDINAIRYVKHTEDSDGHVYKMKASKFMANLLSQSKFGRILPESVRIYICQEFSEEWKAYAGSLSPDYELAIDDDFEKIYSSKDCKGDFGSCMVDRGYHDFYKDHTDTKAAYLLNEEGLIVARCIIWNKVYESNSDQVWRLAERAYSTDGNDYLKNLLYRKLIDAGAIDCHKVVGCGCGEANAIVDIDGDSLSNKELYVHNSANYGDTLSYQDTFKYLNIDDGVAYNYDWACYDTNLDITDGFVIDEDDDDDDEDDRPYDTYHDRYCEEVTVVYFHGTEYLCDTEELDDFILLDDGYHHFEDVVTCACCGENTLEKDAYYSEITTRWYCTEDCMLADEEDYKKEHWHYSDYDQEYTPNPDHLTTYQKYDPEQHMYIEKTIFTATLRDNPDFFVIGGRYYRKEKTA